VAHRLPTQRTVSKAESDAHSVPRRQNHRFTARKVKAVTALEQNRRHRAQRISVADGAVRVLIDVNAFVALAAGLETRQMRRLIQQTIARMAARMTVPTALRGVEHTKRLVVAHIDHCRH